MKMIVVSVNKKEAELEEGLTVKELLSLRGFSNAAVWINGVQLLKSGYDSHIVSHGDDIKILRITAGG